MQDATIKLLDEIAVLSGKNFNLINLLEEYCSNHMDKEHEAIASIVDVIKGLQANAVEKINEFSLAFYQEIVLTEKE